MKRLVPVRMRAFGEERARFWTCTIHRLHPLTVTVWPSPAAADVDEYGTARARYLIVFVFAHGKPKRPLTCFVFVKHPLMVQREKYLCKRTCAHLRTSEPQDQSGALLPDKLYTLSGYILLTTCPCYHIGCLITLHTRHHPAAAAMPVCPYCALYRGAMNRLFIRTATHRPQGIAERREKSKNSCKKAAIANAMPSGTARRPMRFQ